MIDRGPQPSLLAFAAHKAPHLIHLGFLHLPKDDVNVQRSKRVEQPFVHLLDGWLFFFEHVDDRGRTDPQDPDDIAHTTAIERHIDDLLFHGRQPPFVLVLQEENGARTVTTVAAIALGAIGLFPVLHHISTVTIRTLHLHKSHSTSPTRSCGLCAQSYQGINQTKTSPTHVWHQGHGLELLSICW